MPKMSFKDYLRLAETNVPGYHLDGNTGDHGNPVTGGAYLDSQWTGSETKSTGDRDNRGTSLYSTDLGLPTRVERGRVIRKVEDRPKLRLTFTDGGCVEFDRQGWWEKVKGKTDIHDIKPGDRADVEYYANRNDTENKPMFPLSVFVY
jgi:hypothetical protein